MKTDNYLFLLGKKIIIFFEGYLEFSKWIIFSK